MKRYALRLVVFLITNLSVCWLPACGRPVADTEQHQSIESKAAPPSQAPTVNAQPDMKEIEFLERYCFEEVNKQREGHGLPGLKFWDALLPVARNYSKRMAEEGFFSHTDPQGKSVADRVRAAGLQWYALDENLLNIKGYINPVPPTVERWMASVNHRANLLDAEVEYSAVGVWIRQDGTVFFTQVFLGLPGEKAKKQ